MDRNAHILHSFGGGPKHRPRDSYHLHATTFGVAHGR